MARDKHKVALANSNIAELRRITTQDLQVRDDTEPPTLIPLDSYHNRGPSPASPPDNFWDSSYGQPEKADLFEPVHHRSGFASIMSANFAPLDYAREIVTHVKQGLPFFCDTTWRVRPEVEELAMEMSDDGSDEESVFGDREPDELNLINDDSSSDNEDDDDIDMDPAATASAIHEILEGEVCLFNLPSVAADSGLAARKRRRHSRRPKADPPQPGDPWYPWSSMAVSHMLLLSITCDTEHL